LDTLRKTTINEENILVEFRFSESVQLENSRKCGFVEKTPENVGLLISKQ